MTKETRIEKLNEITKKIHEIKVKAEADIMALSNEAHDIMVDGGFSYREIYSLAKQTYSGKNFNVTMQRAKPFLIVGGGDNEV